MKTRVRDIVEQGDKLFSKRQPILSLWQSTAEQFYPERADFTTTFTLGDEFASHLMTGLPALARRDLANNFAAMLRPRQKPWFHCRVDDERINDDATARRWLDHAGDIMRRMMYDPRAKFVRATKEGDNDFSAFGQAAIHVTPSDDLSGLLYRTRHLRDVVWCENADLDIDTVHFNWKLEVRELCRLFPKTVSDTLKKLAEKEPYKEIKCRHVVLPAESYDLDKAKNSQRLPFVSIYVDTENDVILEETPVRTLGYVIPRWQTVSGSQYAYSPATVIALPDSRLLQQITLTLLESGQKAVDPPMVGVAEAIIGGANIQAGGFTWADAEYDERLGEVLRPLVNDPKALNWGVDREERIAEMIKEAFFLNKINLPEIGKDMTAYETQKRVEEYVRAALPLFEPMETEYNGGLCAETFEIAKNLGVFGSPDEMPPVLRGRDFNFVFESPLQSANERAKASAFMEAANLLALVEPLDPGARYNLDVNKAFREALTGVGAPSDWLVDEKDAKVARAQAQQEQAIHEAAAQVGAGGEIASKVGEGAQALAGAGLM